MDKLEQNKFGNGFESKHLTISNCYLKYVQTQVVKFHE